MPATNTKPSLPKAIFGLKVEKTELLSQSVRAHLANRRKVSAQTLTRGKVRGGGKKPWRQKGTGKARAGSIRSPIWRGGGIVFGPTGEENYKIKLSKKSRQLAIKQALSLKASAGAIEIKPKVKITSGKTKDLVAKLRPTAKTSTLYVDKNIDEKFAQAARNLQYLSVLAVENINAYDVLNADKIIITTEAKEALTEKLAPKPKKVKESR